MAEKPIQLGYEKPDEDRPWRDLSPGTQVILGVGSYLVLVAGAILVLFIFRAPGTAALLFLAAGIGACIWAHFRLHWYDFVPAMVISLVVTLVGLPLVGLIVWLAQ